MTVLELSTVCDLDCKEKLRITHHHSGSLSFEILNSKGTRKMECSITRKKVEKVNNFFKAVKK